MTSNFDDDDQGHSNLSDLKAKLNGIVSSIAVSQTASRNLAPQALQTVANQLNDIRPLLQFEQLRAESLRDGDLVEATEQAVAICKDALDSINAAIIRTTVIGLQAQDIAEMQQIRKQIQSAIKTQQVIQVLVRLAGFFRRIVL